MDERFESIKSRAIQFLGKYLEYPDLISFNDRDKSVIFCTERLIPPVSTDKPRVMLLFSNPHPYSVHQGMFLSPNTIGRENLFWPVMEDAGWLPISKENRNPRQIAEICLKAEYPGPFEQLFYCYYAFPTNFPEDLKKIFGREYFNQFIEPESYDEFQKTIQDSSVDAVVTFNKGIYNLVSNNQVERYIKRVMKGELIQSQIKNIDKYIPTFLTFPTSWRFHKKYREFRKASLDTIKIGIFSGRNAPEKETI